ncbi:MAG: SCP2 sterol-binding domain-containing protein [Thermomonas sp.]
MSESSFKSPSFNWKQPAGQALEAALNRALALDEDTRAALRPLDGQRVALQLSAPPLALEIRVEDACLRVGPLDAARAPDLGVRTSLAGLLGQLPMFRRDDAPPVGKLRIEGDAELARRLQQLAQNFDPDWHRPFTTVFGDIAGVQIAKAIARALKHAQVAGRNLAETAAEYVTEESRDVVPRAELDAFHDDVDALRDDVERIAAKIARLRRNMSDSNMPDQASGAQA